MEFRAEASKNFGRLLKLPRRDIEALMASQYAREVDFGPKVRGRSVETPRNEAKAMQEVLAPAGGL